MRDVTGLLEAIGRGEPQRARELMPIVYQELRRLAEARLAREPTGQTLQATALVHEAYLRLVGDADGPAWENRGHFFAAAAEAMRRILIDKARLEARPKHGGDRQRVPLEAAESMPAPPEDLLALDEALNKLAEKDPVKAELVKLRHFAGLTVEEAARCLGVSRATADRWWAYARAWLYRRLNPPGDTSA